MGIISGNFSRTAAALLLGTLAACGGGGGGDRYPGPHWDDGEPTLDYPCFRNTPGDTPQSSGLGQPFVTGEYGVI